MSILFGAPIDNSADGYPPMTYYNINHYEINKNNQENKNIDRNNQNSYMDRTIFTDPISLSFDANIPLVKKKEQVDDFSINSREYFNGDHPMPEQRYQSEGQRYQSEGRRNFNDAEYYDQIVGNNKKGIMNTKFNDGQHYKSNDIINNVNLNIKENKMYQIDRNSHDFVKDNINDKIKKKFIQDAIHEPDHSHCKNTKQKIKIQRKKINHYCNMSKNSLWNIIYLFFFIIIILTVKILYDNKIIRF